MDSICPYCHDSDTYHAVFIPAQNDSGYNKCYNCDKWSLYIPGQGQAELPDGVTDEQLDQQINQ